MSLYFQIFFNERLYAIKVFLKIYFRNSTRLGFRWLTKSKETIKGPLSGLRQFLTTESPFKIMKNAFYFTLEALFVLEIFLFLSWLFGYEEKQRDSKTVRNTAWGNKVGRLVPDLSLFFEKALYKEKASRQRLSFNIFWWTSPWAYN